MTSRPLHALLLPAGDGRLMAALAAALDGTGPAILPLDPALPPARVSALLSAFTPIALETESDTQRPFPAPAAPGSSGPGVPEDTAVVIATSGSTGEPKGVQLSAAALLHSARASLARIGAQPGERWLCPLPTSHIAGVGVLVRSLLSGVDPLVLPRLDPAGHDLRTLGCAHASLVPTQLRRLLAAQAEVAAFRTILLGGAAIPAALLAGAREAGAHVVTTYGMSETCGGCVYDGTPLAGVQVRTDGTGRIKITGPVLFSGYRNRPDLTAEALAGGWFHTTDVGTLDPGGTLRVHGRADDIINTGGKKVAPAEVAAALETHPAVREAVVVGEPDPDWGQCVTAIVVPATPASPPTLQALQTHVRQSLPPHAAPKTLRLVREIPLLASGKPDLVSLKVLSGS
ncbi:MAG TPA: AMP-binding protein [Streptosporangiaceae bacterium]|jgi:O-succinylbenzoic acid--CoA ligase